MLKGGGGWQASSTDLIKKQNSYSPQNRKTSWPNDGEIGPLSPKVMGFLMGKWDLHLCMLCI